MDLLLRVIWVGIALINPSDGLENLAEKLTYKGLPSQSSTHTNGKWAAENAVDGRLQGDDDCSFTQSEKYKTAWWKLTLIRWSNVAYLQIYFRKSTLNRHIGFNVIVFNETTYIPSSNEPDGGYRVFIQDPSHCIEQVMNMTVNRVTKGIALFNSKDPPLPTNCSGYIAEYATIEICEVMVMGCESSRYGEKCTPCSSHCFDKKCDAFDGSCIYGCSDRFIKPSDCRICRDGLFGQNCEGTCGNCKNGAVCNKITGICPHGCHYQWDGPMCNLCKNRFYGDNCTKTCGHCKPGTYCHNSTGICQEGCDDRWNGSHCDVLSSTKAGVETSNTSSVVISVLTTILVVIVSYLGVM